MTVLPPPPEPEPPWHVPDTLPPPDEPRTNPEMASLEIMIAASRAHRYTPNAL